MGGASRFMMLLTVPLPSVLHHQSTLKVFRRLSLTASSRQFTVSFPKSFHYRRLHIPPHSSLREANSSSIQRGLHPWPEWSHLISNLFSQGKNGLPTEAHELPPDDAFVAYEEKALSDEFVRSASACLAFARAQPDLLRLLPRKDIEVIVSNGTPFLFKSALATAKRMREFLGLDGSHALESEKASTVDIMKYILSYASNPSGSYTQGSVYSSEFVESSVRNLLCQITELSLKNPVENLTASDQYHSPCGYDQSARPLRQNVQMKRGDWFCPKCCFMNFARNVKCLECEEPRPKRLLTGGEWECPECKFFNYGRNLVCLKCDCKRPGEVVANSGNSMLELGYASKSVHNSSMDSRSAENEENAGQWFSKVSQLNNASAVSNAEDDEDFPEIMPLRKGENKFVVSTRKTPLERRSVNSRNQRYLGNYGTSEGSTSQNEHANRSLDLSIRKSLDQILGHSSATSGMGNQGIAAERNAPTDTSAFPRSTPSESRPPLERNSSVPFVPFPADMFSKQDQKSEVQTGKDAMEENCDLPSSSASHQSASVTSSYDSQKSNDVEFPGKSPKSETGNHKDAEEQGEKSERWFQRVAELHNVKDLPSAISDEDFPEIMPTRGGENRFIVSKKKDRSLTSPAYKRQVAMEQGSSPSFVPFVPFPPGYFARKDTSKADEHLENSEIGKSSPDSVRQRVPEDNSSETGKPAKSSGQPRPNLSSVQRVPLGEESDQNSSSSQNTRAGTGNNGYSSQSIKPHVDLSQMQENQNGQQSGWTGKSLEGSAVKEPDPLDMSEEAKAERWFRRVAQIKDISELSQIPDEDFPSIMPMRKGVNRFVVSKRKTPLERRLTSPQHKRNLRTARDDPVNKETDSS